MSFLFQEKKKKKKILAAFRSLRKTKQKNHSVLQNATANPGFAASCCLPQERAVQETSDQTEVNRVVFPVCRSSFIPKTR